MSLDEQALRIHEENRGKISVASKVAIRGHGDLGVIYTPGVAAPCLRIYSNPEDVYRYTPKGNLVAVVTDGSAVLGLGDIGPEAAIPVMEGKAILFKELAGIDAFPLSLASRDVDVLVDTIYCLAPVFGGINLEDIAAPRCFEVERRLRERLTIPVFHDDQHGTAIVTVAALMNALKLTGREWEKARFVVNGAGAAGTAIVKMLVKMGAGDIMVLNRNGILTPDDHGLVANEAELARMTNIKGHKGTLRDAMAGADVFIGVSAPGVVDVEMIRSMAPDPIVLALANPVPEIMPEDALMGGARIVATGRSDFANQVNNVMAFPGVFRGALDVRAREINEAMKEAAARAIATLVLEEELTPNHILPDPLDPRIVPAVATAVAKAAVVSGACL